MGFCFGVSVLLLVSASFLGQSSGVGEAKIAAAPAASRFDVVSIHESAPGTRGSSIRPRAANFVVTGATLKFLVQEAYDLHDFEIEREPVWADTDRFDITAKADESGAEGKRPEVEEDELLKARLRALLAERFHLQVHREMKEHAVLELVVAGKGPRLQPAVTNTGYSSGPGHLKCSDSSMSDLASMLSDSLDVMVLDRTHLTGSYAFALSWKPQQRAAAEDDRPELPTALEEQLGLKLMRTTGSVEMLVVDHVERPSAN